MNAAEIVVATLRQLASWSEEDCLPESLAALAREVEEHDFADSWCCPMCQEIQCDGGCPLAEVRAP